MLLRTNTPGARLTLGSAKMYSTFLITSIASAADRPISPFHLLAARCGRRLPSWLSDQYGRDGEPSRAGSGDRWDLVCTFGSCNKVTNPVSGVVHYDINVLLV